jgi:glutathione S-transferase
VKYFSVAEACKMPGLRLVLSANVPGPWSESAKALLNARGVAYAPVEQVPGGANEDLCGWTGGIRNAPIAMLDSEPPIHGWLDIVMLAERLGSGPSLLPEQSLKRVLALGLSAELCAPDGFGWARRLLMFEKNFGLGDLAPETPAHTRAMLAQYGFSAASVQRARVRMIDIMGTFADQLERQRAAGSPYLVAGQLSTADLHWACFSQMVAPLALADQPNMPQWLIEKYSDVDESIAAALHPSLIEHRDFIYRDHIGLPLEF